MELTDKEIDELFETPEGRKKLRQVVKDNRTITPIEKEELVKEPT